MTVVLNHQFCWTCHDMNYLLEAKTLSSFLNRLEKLAKKEAGDEFDASIKKINQSKKLKDAEIKTQVSLLEEQKNSFVQKYKGDGFELFGEFLIRWMGSDPLIGVYDYKVEVAKRDWGVDGYGTGDDGKPMTVQFKCYKSNEEVKWNEARLGNFVAESFSPKYGVESKPRKDKIYGECHNMLLITSGKGLHWSVENRDDGSARLRVLNYEAIRTLVDNRPRFWLEFKESWEASLSQEVSAA